MANCYRHHHQAQSFIAHKSGNLRALGQLSNRGAGQQSPSQDE